MFVPSQDVREELKQASAFEDAEIRIEKTIASGVKITIRVRPSAETIDLEGLTPEELTEILEALEQKLESIQMEEPEADDPKVYEKREDTVEDLQLQIDTVQTAIEEWEDEEED